LDRVDHGTEAKAVTHGLRYNADLNNRIEAATKPGGSSSPNTFLRAAIKRELAGRESGVDVAEQSIAASLDRIAREICNLWLGQQALFAFVDALAKTFLTCARTAEGCARSISRPRQSAL
jgi:hypothetical protein